MMNLRAIAYRATLAVAGFARPKSVRNYSLGILKLDRLGDAVLALGVIRKLISAHDSRGVLLVVSDTAAPLYRAEFPGIDLLELPAFSHRYAPDFIHLLLGNALRVQTRRVDRLVCLRHQPSDYLHAIACLLRPRECVALEITSPAERVDLEYPSGRRAPYPTAPIPQGLELEAHRRVAELVLNQPVSPEEIIPRLNSVARQPGESLLLCPVAGDLQRMVSPCGMAQAVAGLLRCRSTAVDLCLPPNEDDEPWVSALREAGCGVRHVVRPTDAVTLAQAIASARIVLANESAPAHLATALDQRGVFLIGGGHYGILAPWRRSDRQRWLSQPMACFGCEWHCRFDEARCITEIAPERIAHELLNVLDAE
jgi:ADP-heptose:LPS heptosyltransferase